MSQEQRENFEFFSSQPPPEETFRSVLLSVLNEFLDGDFEVIRSFLREFYPRSVALRSLTQHKRGNEQFQFITTPRGRRH